MLKLERSIQSCFLRVAVFHNSKVHVIKRVNKVLLKMSISQGHSYLVIGAQAEVNNSDLYPFFLENKVFFRWKS